MAYNGAQFCGWQEQPIGRSVESVLYRAIRTLPFPVERIQAAGRTDAGVHANGQVVAFSMKKNNIPVHKYPHILNPKLPHDLQVLHSEEVPLLFNPRRDATSRLYCYRIAAQEGLMPTQPNITIIRHALSLSNINILADLFVGTHDFTAFCSSKDMNKTKIRTIYSAQFIAVHNQIHFYIRGNAFLMNMVRQIVGTIIEPIAFETNYQRIKLALLHKDKAMTGPTALPHGLTLEEVSYKKPHSADEE
ncbi:tRNA pseudouridine(38-40) synthase TruA [Entomospira culicis]|nr:tRNA pseudouridine(38-40) synthase TruA [Entomospira culicis]WDI37959.1 tRNA pseudouridine(38-40) synthase TruA [Entomospira culicis]WDI39584.1 tRNA pseudouridine(38-40) synthase TruA [Entomospira culicis]